MASQILTTYKQQIANLTLVPQGGGCFELTVGSELIYSKLDTGEFPDESEMVEKVGACLKSAAG